MDIKKKLYIIEKFNELVFEFFDEKESAEILFDLMVNSICIYAVEDNCVNKMLVEFKNCCKFHEKKLNKEEKNE